MLNLTSFDEFLDKLSFNDTIQSYFNPEVFFRIFFIDPIDSRILLSVKDNLMWFTEIDFLFGKVCI